MNCLKITKTIDINTNRPKENFNLDTPTPDDDPGDDFKEIFEEELKMRKVTTNYKGTKITGNTAAEVIFEVKRLMDKENHQNHVIFGRRNNND
jgi:hypothetical protein